MTTVTPRPKKKRAKRDYSKQCDVLFSQIIRSVGKCESGRLARHSGVLQCAHGFSRRYRAVRWDHRNAFCFCAGCHIYFTHHPIEWDLWLRERWGEEQYDEIRSLALEGVQPDFASLLVELKDLARQVA